MTIGERIKKVRKEKHLTQQVLAEKIGSVQNTIIIYKKNIWKDVKATMLTLYHKIRQRREELGMTQDELARKMGYKSRSSINKIEKGENDIPQSKIMAFAAALETTPEYLMGWTVEPNANTQRHLSTQEPTAHICNVLPVPKGYKIPIL